MKDHFNVGDTGTYINDYRQFVHVAEIPQQAAIAWVKEVCGDTLMGLSFTARELTVDEGKDTDATRNGWLNKLFVVVDTSHGRAVALYNHDGSFSVYQG